MCVFVFALIMAFQDLQEVSQNFCQNCTLPPRIRTPNCGAFRGPPRKPVSEDQPGEGETTPTVTISNTPPER